MTDLRKVKEGKVLFWPEAIASRHESSANMIRLRAGGIVDMDAPCERETFCRGQEYKLEAVSKKRGFKPDPIKHAPALRRVKAELEKVTPPPPPPSLKKKADKLGIMDPQEPAEASNSVAVGVTFPEHGVTQGLPPADKG